MRLDKVLGPKVASRALDLRIDLGQGVAKVLPGLVTFILIFGHLLCCCHVLLLAIPSDAPSACSHC
jgi:hypothetical protein